MSPRLFAPSPLSGFTLVAAVLTSLLWPNRVGATSQNPARPTGRNPASAEVEGKATREKPDSETVVAWLNRYEVKARYQSQFRKALSDYVTHSLSLEGNIMSEAYYEPTAPSVLWLIERWGSQSELDGIHLSPESKAVLALSAEALVKPPECIELEDLEPLSKSQWRRPAKSEDRPLTIMLFIDARVGTQDTFRDVYHAVMPAFRDEPGVVTYQLSQLKADETKFVTYEKFRSDEAFAYHLKFPAIKPVIDYLNTSIKKPPFQAGLHTLIEFAPLTRETSAR